MRYTYIKAPFRPVKKLATNVPSSLSRQRKIKVFLPVVLMGIGIFLFGYAALPILSYQFFISPRFRQPEFLTPVSSQNLISQSLETFTPIVLGEEEVDNFLAIEKWFPSAPKLEVRSTKITHYTISVPKLKIENAVVKIGGLDIKKKLIQYPGTANPGQPGNAVLFGHSVLPQFFNPQNYQTIFSTLPTLKHGDEIMANFDGVIYKYKVEEMIEVSPDDVSVLEQRYDDAYITLITCVPPGTYLRRLIVRARLSVR